MTHFFTLLALLQTQPAVDPVITQIGKLVGKWDGVAHAGQASFKCKFDFEWNPDHRGVHGDADIAIDSPTPMHSLSIMGWDANAKAVYYVDAHDSDTLYTGHIYLEGEKLVFKFGNYGKGEKEFVSTEWFTDSTHYVSEIRQAGHEKEAPMIRVEMTKAS